MTTGAAMVRLRVKVFVCFRQFVFEAETPFALTRSLTGRLARSFSDLRARVVRLRPARGRARALCAGRSRLQGGRYPAGLCRRRRRRRRRCCPRRYRPLVEAASVRPTAASLCSVACVIFLIVCCDRREICAVVQTMV